MSFSKLLRQKILQRIFSADSIDWPTFFFLGVSTTKPTTLGENITEPDDPDYTRVAIALASWNAVTDVEPILVSNSQGISFTATTAWWGGLESVAYTVLFDSASVFLAYGEIARPRQVFPEDQLFFDPGSLQFGLVE